MLEPSSINSMVVLVKMANSPSSLIEKVFSIDKSSIKNGQDDFEMEMIDDGAEES